MLPLVSVIMPAYNHEQYIAESIQSVLDQSYQNWELLIVDDGSIDKTADVVRRFTVKDSRIKSFFQQNGQQAKARNTAIGKSNGSLLAFLDSDDLWLPEKIERQLETLVTTNADVIYSNGFIIYEQGATPGPADFPIVAGTVEGRKMFDLLLLVNFIPILSVLLRRETFENGGPFDESVAYHGCDDYELWLKLADYGAVFHGMTEKLVKYRRHTTAMSYKTSTVFKPELRTVAGRIDRGSLDEKKKRTRLRGLYRDLIAALVEEGELAEAQEFLREFSAWDKSGVVTSLQKLLIKVSPRSFNTISRECLYRAEWHLQKLTGKRRTVDS